MKAGLFSVYTVKVWWFWLVNENKVNYELAIILIGLDHREWYVIDLLSILTFLYFLGYGVIASLLSVSLAENKEGIGRVN